ncbi:MAG: N-acetyl-gamma-glutamyl-phosphate reductase [Acidobacteriota bacterium]
MLNAAIAGGSGYGGLELMSVLLRHPHVRIQAVSSEQHAGAEVCRLYPHLRGIIDLSFSPLEDLLASKPDVMFLALPHGEAMRVVPKLPAELIVIDLSGDFRLRDPHEFERYYGFPMTALESQPEFVYGLPEINRDSLRGKTRVANPGCFATATILALYPLYREDWIEGSVFVDSKTGSSGAGRTPSPGTHHPRRSHSVFPYKPFAHQHLPEMRQILDNPRNPLVFQAHSTPLVRGIFASHYLKLKTHRSAREVEELYARYYGSEPFIRWIPDMPDSSNVEHSNIVDLAIATDEDHLIVWSALDNLQKGAAGQAVQNMNLLCGFPETTAINQAPLFP